MAVEAPERRLLSPEEAATVLNCVRETVYRLIKRKRLRASKVGSHWRIAAADVEAYLRKTQTIPGDSR